MNISELSIRRPVLATVLTIIILLFGFIGYNYLGVREYPSVDNPIISVSCSYPGANADVIENQITEPLEQNINGIPGIRSLSSVSQQGQSRITVEFELSVDLETAANDVRDKVSRAQRYLPRDCDPPTVSKADADAMPILMVALQSDKRSSTIVTLNDADGNMLVKYTFDTDTSLIKKQGIVESLAMDRSNFEFGDKDKTYTITYLCGKSTSKLGLFEVGSEHGNSRLADGVYPTSYKYGEKVIISTLKRDYGCGGIYHSGSGSPSATYRFSGWYLDWNLTQPFTGEFPAGTVGDIVLYADITMTGTHYY